MPIGDKTKKPAFQMWLAGQSLPNIQRAICRPNGTKRSSVKGWVQDWERGKQGNWKPTIS